MTDLNDTLTRDPARPPEAQATRADPAYANEDALGLPPVATAAGLAGVDGLAVVAVLPEEARAPASRGGLWAALREIAETIVLTLLIFFLVRAVLENYKVEGQSMEPNLYTGQYLIVNKVLYNLRTAERGDIIVFKAPRSPDRNFVKRIIGLPGDKVELRQGQVYVNDKLLYEPYLDAHAGSSWGPSVVGQDELFVLGDNRANSSDSRSWGMLPVGNIIGQAWICYWPPQSWGLIPHYALALK